MHITSIFFEFLGILLLQGALARENGNIHKHVQIKCAELGLPYYKVKDSHYCCGCMMGKYVSADCSQMNYKTTTCKDCRHDSSYKSFISKANTQKNCTTSKNESFCLQFMNTVYEVGNSMEDARCRCVEGTYALEPEKEGCRPHTQCPDMFFMSRRGNSTHDTKCTRCPDEKCAARDAKDPSCQSCDPSRIQDSSTSKPPVQSTTNEEAAPLVEHSGMPYWAVAVLVIGALAVGFILGRLWDKLKSPKDTSRNSNEPRSPEEEEQFLSPSQGVSSSSGDLTVSSGQGPSIQSSASATPRSNSRVDSVNETQQVHTGGYVAEPPVVDSSAGTHNTDDIPLKGCIRTMAPDEYEPKFIDKGYRIKYGPAPGPNCLTCAIMRGLNRQLHDDDLSRHAMQLRLDCNRFIESYPDLFQSSIPKSYSSVDNYIEHMNRPDTPCDEVIALAAALTKHVKIQIIPINGDNSSFGSSETSNILIGHVEKNYYLLLEDACERRDCNPYASSNTRPVSDVRIEMESPNQTVSYRANADNPGDSAPQNGSSLSSTDRSSSPPRPDEPNQDSAWSLFNSGDRAALETILDGNSQLAHHLDDHDLAKDMLKGSEAFVDLKLTPLAEKSVKDFVTPFVRLPGLVDDAGLLLGDAKYENGDDAAAFRHAIIDKVLFHMGSKLSVRLLISLSRSHTPLYRLFCDLFISLLPTRCQGPESGSSV